MTFWETLLLYFLPAWTIGGWEIAVVLFLFLPLFFLYLLPIWVALAWNVTPRHDIIVVNILAGWTVIGWIWALVWALKRKRK